MKPESHVAEQFEDAEQQQEAATLGMWTFLATEVLFLADYFSPTSSIEPSTRRSSLGPDES